MLNKLERARIRLQQEGKKIFNLSAGNLADFGLEFPLKFPKKFPQYQPQPKGDLSARQAVSNFYASRKLNVDTENIFLTSGTSESYLHLFKMLAGYNESANHDCEILFPNPSYPLFDHLAGLANIKLQHYKLDPHKEWQINLDDLAAKINHKTRAIVLISPNNPTGGVLTKATLKAVLALAEKHSLPIISDEVFSEFIYDEKVFPRIAKLLSPTKHTGVPIFTLNGVSKTYALPGLKLSWIVTQNISPQQSETLELSIDTLLAANQISQQLLPHIIEDGEKFILEARTKLENNRNLAIEILSKSPNISFVKPAGGFHLFAEIKNFRTADGRTGTDEEFALQLLQKTGIFVHPGYFYDYEQDLRALISFVGEPKQLSELLEIFTTDLDKNIKA